jgi:tetratricopeptide (TPR) repeat protein
MGWVYARMELCTEAQDHANRCMEFSRMRDDGFGEAGSHFVLAIACCSLGQESEAFDHAKQCLDFFCTTNDHRWQARAHRLYAWIYSQQEDYIQSVEHCRRALYLLQHTDSNPHYEIATLENLLAWTHYRNNNYQEAITCYGRAVTIYQEQGHQYGEADIMRRLGDTYHAAGDRIGAQMSWQRALEIADSLNLPTADPIRVKLNKRMINHRTE